MAGEDVKIAIDQLDVDGHMRNRLRAVHQHAGAVAVGGLGHFGDGNDRAQGVGDVGDGYQFGAGAEEFFVFFENDLAGAIDGHDAQAGAFFGAEHLPGDDVGVVFEPGDNDLIILLNILSAPSSARRG